ncbi:MAG: hypothetical protein NTY47_07335, partial [Candidatus Omnitrophica bacterium]|nr:hypothetical protein [Candidatus Omnitrophota bacterium]
QGKAWDKIYVMGAGEITRQELLDNANAMQSITQKEKALEISQLAFQAYVSRVFHTLRMYAKDADSRQVIDKKENEFFFAVQWRGHLPCEDEWASGEERLNEITRYYYSYLSGEKSKIEVHLNEKGRDILGDILKEQVSAIDLSRENFAGNSSVLSILSESNKMITFKDFTDKLGEQLNKDLLPAIAGYKASLNKQSLSTVTTVRQALDQAQARGLREYVAWQIKNNGVKNGIVKNDKIKEGKPGSLIARGFALKAALAESRELLRDKGKKAFVTFLALNIGLPVITPLALAWFTAHFAGAIIGASTAVTLFVVPILALLAFMAGIGISVGLSALYGHLANKYEWAKYKEISWGEGASKDLRFIIKRNIELFYKPVLGSLAGYMIFKGIVMALAGAGIPLPAFAFSSLFIIGAVLAVIALFSLLGLFPYAENIQFFIMKAQYRIKQFKNAHKNNSVLKFLSKYAPWFINFGMFGSICFAFQPMPLLAIIPAIFGLGALSGLTKVVSEGEMPFTEGSDSGIMRWMGTSKNYKKAMEEYEKVQPRY